MKAERITEISQQVVEEVERAIVGKRETVERAFLALACNGHVLLEDIPGVGKTTLAKALAAAIGGDFRRIQFTPDLLPADVTGSNVFDQRTAEFSFRAGPVFGNVILADEINRATPKAQSSLLEAMEERQVTTDGETRPLPLPFFVIATQNNLEMTGTYPLPEAQLDRFFCRLSLGYPDRDAEIAILSQQQVQSPLDLVRQVIDPVTMRELQSAVKDIFVHDTIRAYIVDILRATRTSPLLSIGASPRGSLHLMRGAQARAAMTGGAYVKPDDVKSVAPVILGHRVLARSDARLRGESAEAAITKIVNEVPAPLPVA